MNESRGRKKRPEREGSNLTPPNKNDREARHWRKARLKKNPIKHVATRRSGRREEKESEKEKREAEMRGRRGAKDGKKLNTGGAPSGQENGEQSARKEKKGRGKKESYGIENFPGPTSRTT